MTLDAESNNRARPRWWKCPPPPAREQILMEFYGIDHDELVRRYKAAAEVIIQAWREEPPWRPDFDVEP